MERIVKLQELDREADALGASRMTTGQLSVLLTALVMQVGPDYTRRLADGVIAFAAADREEYEQAKAISGATDAPTEGKPS